jgi:CrcB protein
VGGVIGAEARYGLGLALPHDGAGWPWSTLLVNTSGCVLIGALMVLLTERGPVHPLLRPLLGIGVLGGYTTFSTYAVDVLSMVGAGRGAAALGYLLVTPVLAVLGVTAGTVLTRRLGPGGPG